MPAMLNAILVLVLLLNLFALGTSRLNTVIRAVAFQCVLLGCTPILVHEHVTVHVLMLCAALVAIKGAAIPSVLARAMRQAQIKREVEPLIGLLPSMLLGALATGLAIAFAGQLPLAPGPTSPLLVPASFATVLTGFLLLTTRAKAISQVLGYLVLENGIFIFGLLLLEAMPFLVEIGVLLDVFVVIFVASIIIHHINAEFASLDTRRLSILKE